MTVIDQGSHGTTMVYQGLYKTPWTLLRQLHDMWQQPVTVRQTYAGAALWWHRAAACRWPGATCWWHRARGDQAQQWVGTGAYYMKLFMRCSY